MKPHISVVIPTYNEEKFLPKLLESLKVQTYKGPYEVIVVDNNSTDKTSEIAQSMGARVIKEKKQGYAHACNAGFYGAKADIIARADADYVLPKTWLQTVADSFEKRPDIVAVGGPLYPLESYWWENFLYYPATVGWMYLLKFLQRGFLFPNIAVRKSAFEKIGGFDTTRTFGEDQELCFQLKKVGKVEYNLNMYIYTSMRRMTDIGMMKLVFGYSIANQIALWRGKEVKFGTGPARVAPNKPITISNPWMFLLPLPTLILVLLVVTSYLLATPKEMLPSVLLQILAK